ncbi:hypothetical protein TNCV_2984871 [Trichonephila clavipes]|nr:hypothetical protein TNCV_2984871 [Trichonephila clavipes]
MSSAYLEHSTPVSNVSKVIRIVYSNGDGTLPWGSPLSSVFSDERQPPPSNLQRSSEDDVLLKDICLAEILDGTAISSPPPGLSNRGSLVVNVTESWPVCYEFEPCIAEYPPCREAMYVKYVESSNVLPLVWKLGEEVPAQLSSSSLDHGSKVRSPSPKALE